MPDDMTTIRVDRIETMPSSSGFFFVDAEKVRITREGFEFWDGEKYVLRPVEIVEQKGNTFVLKAI